MWCVAAVEHVQGDGTYIQLPCWWCVTYSFHVKLSHDMANTDLAFVKKYGAKKQWFLSLSCCGGQYVISLITCLSS